jgi:hypothetical protein
MPPKSSVRKLETASDVQADIPTWLIDWSELRDKVIDAQNGKRVCEIAENQKQFKEYVTPTGSRAKWTGYGTEEIKRWIVSGYQVQGLILGDPPVPIRDKRKLRFNEDEGEFHYDLAMSGDDNYFSEWTKREIIPGLAVEAEISFVCSTDNKILTDYFAWICRAVYSLEENGVDCQVSLTMTMPNVFGGYGDPKRRTIVRVKKENEISDFTFWSAMISPACFRTFGFCAQTLNADAHGRKVSSGQGSNSGSRQWSVKFNPDRRVMEIKCPYSGGGYSFPEEDMTRQLHEALAETRKAVS